MPTTITLGHIEAHEKLTAKVYFRPSGQTGYVSLGNIKEYNEAHEFTAVTRVIAEHGFRRTSDEQVDVTTYAWEFTLDEFDANLVKLLTLGSQGSTVQQAAATAPAGTATLTSIKTNRWYSVGKVGLDTLVAKIGVTTLTEGTDYDVDLDAGMIYLHSTAQVTDGANVALTFGNDAVDFEVFTPMNDLGQLRGDFILSEFNQHSKSPLKTSTFTGTLRPTEFPAQTGEFATWKLRVMAATKPTVQKRSAA